MVLHCSVLVMILFFYGQKKSKIFVRKAGCSEYSGARRSGKLLFGSFPSGWILLFVFLLTPMWFNFVRRLQMSTNILFLFCFFIFPHFYFSFFFFHFFIFFFFIFFFSFFFFSNKTPPKKMFIFWKKTRPQIWKKIVLEKIFPHIGVMVKIVFEFSPSSTSVSTKSFRFSRSSRVKYWSSSILTAGPIPVII